MDYSTGHSTNHSHKFVITAIKHVWTILLSVVCWLIGALPRFRVDLGKQIPVLLALSETVRAVKNEVSPEVVWEGARTRFPHPWDV